VKEKAFDASGNDSLNFSSTVQVTTLSTPDTTPPSDPGAITVGAVTTASVALSWTLGTDDAGFVQATLLEGCVGVGCTNFQLWATIIGNSTYTETTHVQPLTVLRFRIQFRDNSNNLSLNYSPVLNVMTPDVPTGTKEGLCNCRRNRR
jgi:cellulose 1,4-beta-cellobiosidase